MFLAHLILRLRWRVTRIGPSKRAMTQFRWSYLPYSFPTSSSSLQSCSKSRTASITSLGNQARTLDFDIRSLGEGLYGNASTHLEGPGPIIVRNGPLFSGTWEEERRIPDWIIFIPCGIRISFFWPRNSYRLRIREESSVDFVHSREISHIGEEDVDLDCVLETRPCSL